MKKKSKFLSDKVLLILTILIFILTIVIHTYYSYSTRGCIQDCAWCGVKSIEPQYASYIDIKPVINDFRLQYGDKPKLKLMDSSLRSSAPICNSVSKP